MLRRVQRVFPLYWIALSIKILIDSRQKDIVWATGSYLLLPVFSPSGLIEPIHGVGWSLVWEMVFYYVFALSLSLHRRSGFALILSTLVFLTFVGYLTTFRSVAWHGSSIFLLFALGIVIGIVTQSSFVDRSRHSLLGAGLALAALAIGIAIIVFQIRDGWFEFLELVLSAAIILAAAVAPNINPSSLVLRVMHLIGDASYSLYLTHTLTFSLIRSILKRANLLSLEASLWPWMIAIACAVGVLVHVVVEKKIIAYFRLQKTRDMKVHAKSEISH
ncbi:acyltransferase [Methylobacterium goesingense]|nr:acyltransferase family protein [Methylobacterium goesingense]MCI9882196.1 acyltransferase [Methylobacterium goesingense]